MCPAIGTPDLVDLCCGLGGISSVCDSSDVVAVWTEAVLSVDDES